MRDVTLNAKLFDHQAIESAALWSDPLALSALFSCTHESIRYYPSLNQVKVLSSRNEDVLDL